MLGNNFRDKRKRTDEERTRYHLKSGERRTDMKSEFLHQAGLMDHPLYTQEIISALCPPFLDMINWSQENKRRRGKQIEGEEKVLMYFGREVNWKRWGSERLVLTFLTINESRKRSWNRNYTRVWQPDPSCHCKGLGKGQQKKDKEKDGWGKSGVWRVGCASHGCPAWFPAGGIT